MVRAIGPVDDLELLAPVAPAVRIRPGEPRAHRRVGQERQQLGTGEAPQRQCQQELHRLDHPRFTRDGQVDQVERNGIQLLERGPQMSLVGRPVPGVGDQHGEVAEPEPVGSGRAARVVLIRADQPPDLPGDRLRLAADPRAGQDPQRAVGLRTARGRASDATEDLALKPPAAWWSCRVLRVAHATPHAHAPRPSRRGPCRAAPIRGRCSALPRGARRSTATARGRRDGHPVRAAGARATRAARSRGTRTRTGGPPPAGCTPRPRRARRTAPPAAPRCIPPAPERDRSGPPGPTSRAHSSRCQPSVSASGPSPSPVSPRAQARSSSGRRVPVLVGQPGQPRRELEPAQVAARFVAGRVEVDPHGLR